MHSVPWITVLPLNITEYKNVSVLPYYFGLIWIGSK